MSRPKPQAAGAEVFVLEEVWPYDGSTILGVFSSAEAAMKDRPGTWREEVHPKEGEHFWTTEGPALLHGYFLVTGWRVQ